MTVFTIMISCFVGIVLLIVGLVTRSRWLKILALIPLGITVVQLIMLLMMAI